VWYHIDHLFESLLYVCMYVYVYVYIYIYIYILGWCEESNAGGTYSPKAVILNCSRRRSNVILVNNRMHEESIPLILIVHCQAYVLRSDNDVYFLACLLLPLSSFLLSCCTMKLSKTYEFTSMLIGY